MYLRSDSAAGVRFLVLVREGRGLKASARAAGIGKETGYRWLREAYCALRGQGLDPVKAQQQLGFVSTRAAAWERDYAAGRGSARHHRRVTVDVEDAFWAAYRSGQTLEAARQIAGTSRASVYRWLRRRFTALRGQGVTLTAAAIELRVDQTRARRWEVGRRREIEDTAAEQAKADRRAVRDSARYVETMLASRKPSRAQVRGSERERRYWELMRQGLTNAAACRQLGISRRAGTYLRAQAGYQTPQTQRCTTPPSGRYLSLRERLQIADLLRLGCSKRQIATELGRSPSTVCRELARHRDEAGRYLPQTADHAARLGRARPRTHKLAADPHLRRLVQRKLNQRWSPDQICGWLALTFPADPGMQLCPETIYRALLTPRGQGLHKRYCTRLRTGRKIRKSRWLTGSGHGAVVQNMTMIDQRPAVVETKQEAGHWEGDLVVGAESASAMVTLRERKTHYGIIVNLPGDHTAEKVNHAVTRAFASIPAHLKKTLTWDQGVEMARHQELAAATGIDIYFAERSSPWQRGANENFNGLVRQYFPKGTDLSVHTTQHVNAVTRELNTRPRKGLSYRTPVARFRTEARQTNSPS